MQTFKGMHPRRLFRWNNLALFEIDLITEELRRNPSLSMRLIKRFLEIYFQHRPRTSWIITSSTPTEWKSARGRATYVTWISIQRTTHPRHNPRRHQNRSPSIDRCRKSWRSWAHATRNSRLTTYLSLKPTLGADGGTLREVSRTRMDKSINSKKIIETRVSTR